MWICPKCKAENHDSLRMCWWCRTEPDGTEHPRPKQVGVPRRFSVGTLMILIAMFGVLFAVLKMLGTHPIVFAGVAIFFGGVGAAQMFLFKSHDPRKASLVAGFVLGPVVGIGMIVIANLIANNYGVPYNPQQMNLAGVMCCGVGFLLLGAPFGYIAGCLVAGIFLVREREKAEDEEDPNKVDENK